MFFPFFYCHVPSKLGNWQFEQGHVNVIGSFFGKSAFFFITHIVAMCWDPSYEYLVFLSQFVNRQHCVKGSVGLYFGVFKCHNCSMAVMSQFMTKLQLETHCCQDEWLLRLCHYDCCR